MLSIIIPSYNSGLILQRQLPSLIEYLNQKNIENEILVVDDGSEERDITEKICKKLNCIYLKNDKNLGKGAAVRKGMLFAKGGHRIFTDADIPFNFESVEIFLHSLKESDMAIGDRTLPDSIYYSEISFFRKIAIFVSSILLKC